MVPIGIHPTLAAAGPWLDRFNQWRAATGLSSLSENPTWSTGDYDHAVYMVKNDLVTHYETSGTPYYTVDGDTAAHNSNIYVSSMTSTADTEAIDWWMGAPFHAMGMMDPRLTQTGFGSYRELKPGWQMGAALDVVRGNSFNGGSFPVFFPANGSSEPLTQYSGNEFPDPLQACPGYAVPTGLPVFVEVGGNLSTTAGAVHSFTGNGVALDHCVIDSTNSSVGSYLTTRGGVIVVPRQPLQAGVKYVVSVTVNGLPYTWSFSIGQLAVQPSGWQSLGGSLSSGPGATSCASSTAQVFVLGGSGVVWEKASSSGIWSAWSRVGGNVMGNPAVVCEPGTNHIHLFVEGTDRALYHKLWDGAAWGAWENLGGSLTSSPGVSSCASGTAQVFVLGGDGVVWEKTYSVGAWSGWIRIGGNVTGNPALACEPGTNNIHLFVEGTDHALYHKFWNSASWGGWQNLGGSLSSSPATESCAAGNAQAFVLGGGGVMWRKSWSGGSWSGWQLVGGYWTSDPAAVCAPGATAVNVFGRGADMTLWTGPAALS